MADIKGVVVISYYDFSFNSSVLSYSIISYEALSTFSNSSVVLLKLFFKFKSKFCIPISQFIDNDDIIRSIDYT